MTRPDMLAELFRWDRMAVAQGLLDARKWIWRIMDALDGKPLDPRAETWLREIEQKPAVVAIREELGVGDAPIWERRSA